MRRGRRSEPSPSKVVFAAGGSRSSFGRNLTALPNIKDRANIPVSNSFGRLAENLVDLDSRKETLLSEENKENEFFVQNLWKGKTAANGKTGKVRRMSEKVKGGTVESLKGKHGGGIKAGVLHGPKYQNRPVRGLIFGPTKGELELSESGKRLRIEGDSVGRAGGVFESATDGEMMAMSSSQRESAVKDLCAEKDATRVVEEMSMVVDQSRLTEPMDA